MNEHLKLAKMNLIQLENSTIADVGLNADSLTPVVQVAHVHPDYINVMTAGPLMYQMLCTELEALKSIEATCDIFAEIAMQDANAARRAEYAAKIEVAKQMIANRREPMSTVLRIAQLGIVNAIEESNNETTKH